jgi:transcriptional regulator with XRE-family HTH domain
VAYCAIVPSVLTPDELFRVRTKLRLSQEQMARVLGVSFASVNRWEGGHSGVTGATLDLYLALQAALKTGHGPDQILRGAFNERSMFLLRLFRMAYGGLARKAR